MCGIAGSTRVTSAVLTEMTTRLVHRGPDGNGQWLDVEGGTGLAHARLAIVDLTSNGAQPMVSPCGRYVLSFNGEIYNYRRLRADMEGTGESFATDSDTEVLLRLLMCRGLDGLSDLIGMFAFALWDCERKELLLVRDRLGVKPLVWGRLPDGGVAFASEIHALRAHPGLDESLDREALSAYLACLYVPAPRTLYSGIAKLEPGHWLRWRGGRMESGCWWTPKYDGSRNITVAEAAEELLPVLDDSVRLRMIADVEVGCFLSGGVDSSVIAALMAQACREAGAPPPRTFTMTFDEPAYDERQAAAAVAAHIGSRHTELQARPEAARLLDTMVTRFGEPFGNPTALLIHDLSSKAREHIKVCMAGDGGDEVFAGYPRYQGGLLAERYARVVPRPVRDLVARCAGLIPESDKGRHSLRRAREFLTAAGLPGSERYAAWVEYFSPAERMALLNLEAEPRRPVAELYRAAPGKQPLDAMQQTDLLSFLPGNLLSYGDAMSMSVALEIRLPLLDHRLVEAVGRLSPSVRMAQGKKSVLKQVARQLLPTSIVDRPKLGFNPPMGRWLKGDLSHLVAERLTAPRMAELGLDWAPVAALLARHGSGRRDCALQVWALLVYEAWARVCR